MTDDLETQPSKNHDSRQESHKTSRESGPDLLRGLLLAIMAVDHLAFSLHPGKHGTNRGTERDSEPVLEWNNTAVYIVRTIIHLAAPGFTFLLGMGVVYLGRSRKRTGWSNLRLLQHFALRACILTAITVVWGFAITLGEVWFFNLILFALAVNYLFAGMLWIASDALEEMLAAYLDKSSSSNSNSQISVNTETTPLLTPSHAAPHTGSSQVTRAKRTSWHAINAAILLLAIVTIWWNVWLSPTHGHCSSSATASTSEASPFNILLRIWFWPIKSGRVDSRFPPMAWLSFAILGVLYGRILTQNRSTRTATASGLTAASFLFSLVFVCSRLFRIGNLSEDCLRTPDQAAHHAPKNQYLASAASFFYIVKYNPDVAYWAFTMAATLLLLAVFTGLPATTTRRLTSLRDLGTAPLFFYLVHQLIRFPFIEVCVYLLGYQKAPTDPVGNDYLWGGLIWLVAMVAMWPLCRRYSRFKSTKPSDSIWRLF